MGGSYPHVTVYRFNLSAAFDTSALKPAATQNPALVRPLGDVSNAHYPSAMAFVGAAPGAPPALASVLFVSARRERTGYGTGVAMLDVATGAVAGDWSYPLNHLPPVTTNVVVLGARQLLVMGVLRSPDATDARPPPASAPLILYNLSSPATSGSSGGNGTKGTTSAALAALLAQRELVTVDASWTESSGSVYPIPGPGGEGDVLLLRELDGGRRVLLHRYSTDLRAVRWTLDVSTRLRTTGDINYRHDPRLNLLWFAVNGTVLVAYDVRAEAFTVAASVGDNVGALGYSFAAQPPGLLAVSGRTAWITAADATGAHTQVGYVRLPQGRVPGWVPEPSPTPIPSVAAATPTCTPSPTPSRLRSSGGGAGGQAGIGDGSAGAGSNSAGGGTGNGGGASSGGGSQTAIVGAAVGAAVAALLVALAAVYVLRAQRAARAHTRRVASRKGDTGAGRQRFSGGVGEVVMVASPLALAQSEALPRAAGSGAASFEPHPTHA